MNRPAAASQNAFVDAYNIGQHYACITSITYLRSRPGAGFGPSSPMPLADEPGAQSDLVGMAFQAVSRGQRLSDKVAEQLVFAIEAGELSPGARLPRERELTEKFQVSRIVIREALSRLKSEGLIRSRQGLGAFVTELGDRDVFRLRGDLDGQNDRRQIFELRLIVECSSAKLAAERATKRDLARISAALKDIRASIEAGDEGVDADFRFHVAIAAAAKNSYLESFVSFIGHRLYHSIADARASIRLRFPDRVVTFQREHEVIFDFIRAGDGAGAERAMRVHLENTMGTLL